MRVGIVGHEAAKFTQKGYYQAIGTITKILAESGADTVVSGKCSLGGIDIWAVEVGEGIGLSIREFPPAVESWENGYKPRNLQIARESDEVHCIVVDCLPNFYTGMRFDYCYHCKTDSHVKSGGCWTAKEALKLGKRAYWHVIKNY